MPDIVDIEIPPGCSASGKTEKRYAFRISLPYRLRVGPSFRFDEPETGNVVYLRNKVAVPPYVEDYAEVDRGGETTTDVLLLLESVKPKENRRAFEEDAARLLKDFVVAYLMVSPGEAYGRPGFWGSFEFFNECEIQFEIKTPKNYAMTDENLASLIDYRPKLSGTFLAVPCVPDLSSERVSKIRDAYVLDHREIHHRFEIEAKLGDDPMRSLLMACVALEAAHATLLRMRLIRAHPALEDVETVVGEVLRGSFSAILPVTVAFHFTPETRPPQEEVKSAMEAVKTRNDVMHALRKRGEFKIRSLSTAKLREHTKAVLGLLKYFKTAIENERKNP